MNSNKIQSENQAFRQKHVQQWQSSSLSQAAYCREHQLDQNKLSYYKRKPLDEVVPTQNNDFVSV